MGTVEFAWCILGAACSFAAGESITGRGFSGDRWPDRGAVGDQPQHRRGSNATDDGRAAASRPSAFGRRKSA